MRILVALGGNALLRRGEIMTAENQRANVRIAANHIKEVAVDHEVVVAHGNGPQVGLLALQSTAYEEIGIYPLDVLGAESQAMIGYMIEQDFAEISEGKIYKTRYGIVMAGIKEVLEKFWTGE